MFNFLMRRFHQRSTRQHIKAFEMLPEEDKEEIRLSFSYAKQRLYRENDRKNDIKILISEAMNSRHLAIALGATNEKNPLWLSAALQESWAHACLNIDEGRASWKPIRDQIETALSG